MNAAATTPCAHCGLPVGALGTQRSIDGEEQRFCCYGCCLAFQVHHGHHEEPESVRLLIRLGIGAFLAMNIMTLSLLLYSGSIGNDDAVVARGLHLLLWLLATPALAILGGPFLRDAWRAARGGRVTADSLITLGALAAYSYSAYSVLTGGAHVYFDTAAMLLVIFTLGRYLEALGRARATRSLEPLLQPQRQWASIVEPSGETRRRVSELAPGAVIRVRPGERIPVDGTVLEGESTTDEALLTGESRPVAKTAGAPVLAGSLNGDGPLLVRATATGSSTRWGEICRAVRRASARRSRIELLADRIAAGFVPAVLVLATVTLGYWSLRLPFGEALLIALAVLVVACPCALGLAAPLANSLGLAEALRGGCLVRGGTVLEALARVRMIAFDKTGTLTTGEARLTACRVESDVPADELLRRAAALEQGSEHPLARAVVDAARARKLPLPPASQVRTIPGHGVIGRVAGRNTAIGHARLSQVAGMAISPRLARLARQTEARGCTIAYVGWLDRVRGILMFTDALRPDAAATVAALHRLGLSTLLLTGDAPAVARGAAHAAGIANCFAGLTPAEKQAQLLREAAVHGAVAMVGDGLNDGPVLASATVGVAVGSATDLARETADVVLPAGELARLPWLITLARQVRRRIAGNLAWAFGYNLVALGLAASGLLQPLVAAALMAGSSLLIVLRSLHLDRQREPERGPDPMRTPIAPSTAVAVARYGMPGSGQVLATDLRDRPLRLTRNAAHG